MWIFLCSFGMHSLILNIFFNKIFSGSPQSPDILYFRYDREQEFGKVKYRDRNCRYKDRKMISERLSAEDRKERGLYNRDILTNYQRRWRNWYAIRRNSIKRFRKCVSFHPHLLKKEFRTCHLTVVKLIRYVDRAEYRWYVRDMSYRVNKRQRWKDNGRRGFDRDVLRINARLAISIDRAFTFTRHPDVIDCLMWISTLNFIHLALPCNKVLC